MRKLKLIGIGAGNPDYLTLQAIHALGQVDVVFVTHKRDDTNELVRVRKQVCERYLQGRPYRIVEIQDPERDRSGKSYHASVATWHEQRASLYEALLLKELADDQCGAFLVWGDPALYDSALRIIDQVGERGNVELDVEIIPGISSIQALAARHRISLNQIGEPVHITTGRLLGEETFGVGTNVVVMLDGELAFDSLADDDIEIFWGAYLGTPQEILLSGKVADIKQTIREVRARARLEHGWIMDTYLLRNTAKRP